SQLPRDGKTFARPRCRGKCFLQIDLAAARAGTENPLGAERRRDAAAVPLIAQELSPEEGIVLVIRMVYLRRGFRQHQSGYSAELAGEEAGIGAPRCDELVESPQLHAADGRLHLGHPAICSEAVMHPAELRGRGSKMRRTVILPMIFVAPCCFEDL